MFSYSYFKLFFRFFIFNLMIISGVTAGQPVIAITQIAPHPSLDSIRIGLVEELSAALPGVEIFFENAQGNITLASQIAQKIISLSPPPRVIIPITTPSAQTVYQAARPLGIPVVFAAITDPVSAKLTPSLTQPGDNITGLADVPPLEKQLLLIKEILPSCQNIGVVYNAGEANSVSVVARLRILAQAMGLNIITVSVATTVDVPVAVQSLIGKVDTLFVSNDNTVVSALDSLLKIAFENKLPVFASDPDSVKKGCLAAFAPSQYEIGRQVGRLVIRLLSGVPVSNIPIEQPQVFELSINSDTANQLNIKVPQVILNRAQNIMNHTKDNE